MAPTNPEDIQGALSWDIEQEDYSTAGEVLEAFQALKNSESPHALDKLTANLINEETRAATVKTISNSSNEEALTQTAKIVLKWIVIDKDTDIRLKRDAIQSLGIASDNDVLAFLDSLLTQEKDIPCRIRIFKAIYGHPFYKIKNFEELEKSFEYIQKPGEELYSLTYKAAILRNFKNIIQSEHKLPLSLLDSIADFLKVLIADTTIRVSDKGIVGNTCALILLTAAEYNQPLKNVKFFEELIKNCDLENISLNLFKIIENLTYKSEKASTEFIDFLEGVLLSKYQYNDQIKDIVLEVLTNLITTQEYKLSPKIIEYINTVLAQENFIDKEKVLNFLSMYSKAHKTLPHDILEGLSSFEGHPNSHDKLRLQVLEILKHIKPTDFPIPSLLSLLNQTIKKDGIYNQNDLTFSFKTLNFLKYFFSRGASHETYIKVTSLLEAGLSSKSLTIEIKEEIIDTLEFIKELKQKDSVKDSSLELLEAKDIDSEFSLQGKEKSLDELVAELTKLNNANSNLSSFIKSDELKKQYLNVIECFNKDSSLTPALKPISNWEASDIKTWAHKVKESGKAQDKEFLPEIMAVIKRANILDTGNDPRTIQILSTLILLQNPTKGALLQIATGEGKSTTTAIVAVIKALQGLSVDVVTSSPELAKRDVEERQNFFAMFGLSVDHNCEDKKASGFKKCYAANIVYGDVGNFQHDWLKHKKDLGTKGDRPFDCVLVDESDSMLLDESGKIAMLSSPVPGSEYLEPLFALLWQELNRFDAQVAYSKDHQDFVYVEGKFKSKDGVITLDEGAKIYHLQNLSEVRKDHLISYLRNIIQDNLLPIVKHLKNTASEQIEAWVSSSIIAKTLQEGKDYLITPSTEGELVIAPVDYGSTGVIHANSSWMNGLHQYLQIKHGLKITSETFTTSFISNLGYFKLYGNSMYGMTGTLGSSDSQGLLKEVYPIEIALIPTYKEKQFKELEGIISHNTGEWLKDVVDNIEVQASIKRASLVICESIKNVYLVKRALIEAGYPANKIKLYSRNDNDEEKAVRSHIDSGDVIIATNLAGRGTDIKTTKSVEKNGGLHVVVTFMPKNLRVEEQAFGRTSRQGNQGTAQLIVNMLDIVQAFDVDYGSITDIKELKAIRDEMEASRITHARLYEAPRVSLEDELFSKYCSLHKNLSAKENHKQKLAQLEERWGVSFKKIKQAIDEEIQGYLKSAENINPEKAKTNNEKIRDEAFAKFNSFAKEVSGEYQEGYKIMRNPAYLILEAFNSMGLNNRYETSIELFSLAANLDENFSAPAHYNKAYAIIRNKKGNYKQEAYSELMIAKEQIENVLIPNLELMQIACGNAKDTPLSKQIVNKIELLKLQLKYIELSSSKIASSSNQNSIEISESKLLRDFFDSNNTPESEIRELNSFGVHQLFDVKEVEPPTDVFGAVFMAIAGFVQIGIGIALSMAGNVALGASLIIEGMQDALTSIKVAEGKQINWKDYFTAKGISYAVTVISMGVQNVAQKMAAAKQAAAINTAKIANASTFTGKFATTGITAQTGRIIGMEEGIKGTINAASTFSIVSSVNIGAQQLTSVVAKESIKETILHTSKEYLLKETLKEVAKKVIIDSAVDKLASSGMKHALEGFRDDVEKSVNKSIESTFNEPIIKEYLHHLLSLDSFNGNNYYQKTIMEIAHHMLAKKQDVLVSTARSAVNVLASSSSLHTGVKLMFSSLKLASTSYDISKIINATEDVCHKLREEIIWLHNNAPKIEDLLFSSLGEVLSKQDAIELASILEAKNVFINGKLNTSMFVGPRDTSQFMKLCQQEKLIYGVNFGKFKKHNDLIQYHLKEMYLSSVKDYSSQEEQIKGSLSSFISSFILKSLRSELMMPMAGGTLAKISNNIAANIEKTSKEFKERFANLDAASTSSISGVSGISGVSSGSEVAPKSLKEKAIATRKQLKEDFEEFEDSLSAGDTPKPVVKKKESKADRAEAKGETPPTFDPKGGSFMKTEARPGGESKGTFINVNDIKPETMATIGALLQNSKVSGGDYQSIFSVEQSTSNFKGAPYGSSNEYLRSIYLNHLEQRDMFSRMSGITTSDPYSNIYSATDNWQATPGSTVVDEYSSDISVSKKDGKIRYHGHHKDGRYGFKESAYKQLKENFGKKKMHSSFQPIPGLSLYNDIETKIWHEDSFGGKIYSYKGKSFDLGKDGINIGYTLGGGYNIYSQEVALNDMLTTRVDLNGPTANIGGQARIGKGGASFGGEISAKGVSVNSSISGSISFKEKRIEANCTAETGIGAGFKGEASVSQNKIKVQLGAGGGVMTSVACEVEVKDNEKLSQEEKANMLIENIRNIEGQN